MQIRIYKGVIKCLLIYLLLPLTFASGTYVPPVTTFQSNENVYNAGKESIFRGPKKKRTKESKRSFRKSESSFSEAETVRLSEVERNSFMEAHSKNPACISCHSGTNAFSHSNLIVLKDKLAEIIQDCNGPHQIYCNGSNSSLTKKVGAIVYALKVRYNLGK